MQQQQIDGVGEHGGVNGRVRVVFTNRAVQNAAQLGRSVALSTGPYVTRHTQKRKCGVTLKSDMDRAFTQ